MTKRALLTAICTLMIVSQTLAGEPFERDTIPTAAGDVEIVFIGHGTLMMVHQGKTIHIDPFSRLADYSTLPKADVIMLTHHHRDHLDENALNHVRTESTIMVLTAQCEEVLGTGGMVMTNGDVRMVGSLQVEAVPAYNRVHKRDNGQPYHPRGEGNGYILTFGETRIYVAGDTENTPEMKALKNIEVAFLPMNLPYTMTPEMVADAARAFRPIILYPYHYGKTDPQEIVALLKDEHAVEVRVRRMQ